MLRKYLKFILFFVSLQVVIVLISFYIFKEAEYIIDYLKNELMNHFYHIIVLLFITLTIINIIVNLFILYTSKNRELKELTETLELRIQSAKKDNKKQEYIMFAQARSAQMGDMLSMIAHQWRQPLNAISASAISIAMKKEFNELTDDDINTHTKFIQDHSKLMSNTINDFMNFFKPDSEKKYFTINETINELNKLIASQLKNRGIAFEININEEIKIFGHKKELIHILLNLVGNARDALLIENTNDMRIVVDVEKVNDEILICISDNGAGIDESIIDRIFDPYFTTKEQGSGTGIGLYMVKEMIKNDFKGKVSVDSNKLGHTRFTIVIPFK